MIMPHHVLFVKHKLRERKKIAIKPTILREPGKFDYVLVLKNLIGDAKNSFKEK